MLTLHQLATTTNKPTPTTKEKLIMVPITSSTTALTGNTIMTPNSNCKDIATGNLVKIWISRLTAISIETATTTPNIIIANIIFATLVNDLKIIYLTIMEWNHVKRAYGWYQIDTLDIDTIDYSIKDLIYEMVFRMDYIKLTSIYIKRLKMY